MPEDSVLLIHELVPFGDKAGIIFPIEGKMRIHLSGDSLCNKNKSENIDLFSKIQNIAIAYGASFIPTSFRANYVLKSLKHGTGLYT